jgi:hypothetical protein
MVAQLSLVTDVENSNAVELGDSNFELELDKSRTNTATSHS